MENASKALIIAGGVLIGVLILSLAVYLFIDFGEKAARMHDQITSNQLTQFNAQFNVYAGRNDVTIYQIITVANLAYENNIDEVDNNYKVRVFLQSKGEISQNEVNAKNLINEYGVITSIDDNENLFTCLQVKYHENGRVSEIHFKKN